MFQLKNDKSRVQDSPPYYAVRPLNTFIYYTSNSPKAGVQRLALLRRKWKVLRSNLGLQIACPNRGFSDFPLSFTGKCRTTTSNLATSALSSLAN